MHIDALGEISHDPLARAGALMLIVITGLALFAPLFTNYSPHDYTGRIFSPPDRDHPLGTDSMGQDIWTRLLYGARTSLLVAGAVALISSSLSVLVGPRLPWSAAYMSGFS